MRCILISPFFLADSMMFRFYLVQTTHSTIKKQMKCYRVGFTTNRTHRNVMKKHRSRHTWAKGVTSQKNTVLKSNLCNVFVLHLQRSFSTRMEATKNILNADKIYCFCIWGAFSQKKELYLCFPSLIHLFLRIDITSLQQSSVNGYFP